MKKITILLTLTLLTALVDAVYTQMEPQTSSVFAVEAAQPEPLPPYVEKVRQMAEEMEVFPIDFIAQNGPLSHCDSNHYDGPEPKLPFIWRRLDLNLDATIRFYKFCQLALDAKSEDVDALIERLPQASPKEQGLILTILYVYVYPWKSCENYAIRHENLEGEKTRDDVFEAIRELEKEWSVRPWLFMRCKRGEFRLESRSNIGLTKQRSQELRQIVESYLSNDEIAFPAIKPTIESTSYESVTLREKQKSKRLQDLQDEFGRLDLFEKIQGFVVSPFTRKKLLDEIYAKYPSETASEFITIMNFPIMEEIYFAMGTCPAGNASDMPKTVGQIARQLLCSWQDPLNAD